MLWFSSDIRGQIFYKQNVNYLFIDFPISPHNAKLETILSSIVIMITIFIRIIIIILIIIVVSYRVLRFVRHDAHGAVQAKYKYKRKCNISIQH